ncbi:MAG: LD-carboxypeptidase [Bacteroidia bacterium]|nr:LD-carboxypeptidase [Bacteroidia bacterium]MCX7763362.1 LD-carboxypeptidase [Bacteroidia bacterium]MDW8056859.1 LD-carboxypeptidase [Bacteroidia bacterium]
MRWPPPLQPGSTVALVAPSRGITPADIAPFIDFAQKQKWRLLYGPELFARAGIFAGADNHRLNALQQALDSPEINAIWCVRGGHGVSRLWEALSWAGFQRYPKWLIGFSDITPLLWAAAKAGIVALHAPLAVQIPHKVSQSTLEKLLFLLRSEEVDLTITWHRRPWYAWREGKAFGMLLGGNLSMLQTLCGTSLDLSVWAEKPILFWEEVGEYYYRLDRLSWHLRNAGWYKKSTALLVGSLTAMQDNEEEPLGKLPSEIVSDTYTQSAPLAMGLPAGHDKHNTPLPIGAQAYLTIEEREAYLRFWRSS